MIQAKNLNLSFGPQDVFKDISFLLQPTQRIGLVGRNGSGKSTLLKVIAGLHPIDSGTISLSKDFTLGYLPQEVVLESDRSILDETFETFTTLHTLKQELSTLEKELVGEHSADLTLRYARLCDALNHEEPDKKLAQTKKMLLGLGFSQTQFDQSVTTLSTGWKMRIVLAKLLLKDADFYLFDEPTNHLDLIAKEWFLGFLKKAKFGFMIVCHERYFMNELCSSILELENGNGKLYTGNYTLYEQQKEKDLQLLEKQYEQQERELKSKMATIERFRASATKAKMAQSMLKAVEKIERIELPPSPKTVHFHLPVTKQPGKIVLTVTNLAQTFITKEQTEKKVFNHVTFQIERGQKVALVAPNGVGKTTLFNVIVGNLPIQHGGVTFGHNVYPAIFAQDQSTVFDGNKSILENLITRCSLKTEQQIRTFLGSFLFSGEDCNKKIKVLSGGEKNRVGMVFVLLQDANFLLLDEPTNHLDIPSKDVLVKALQAFEGTLFFVSHDREFINALATHTIELSPEGTKSYHGNYDSYVAHKAVQNNDTLAPSKNITQAKVQQASTDTLCVFEQRKKIKRLEEKIERLEKQIDQQELAFAELTYGSKEFSIAQARLVELKKAHALAFEEWEQLHKD